jgi:thiamine biosynthesis lipoprotein
MIYKHEFHAMGCKILALIDSGFCPSILGEVSNWFEDWEQVLSRFRSDSELSQLNLNSNPGSPMPVSQTLWDVYQASVDAVQLTGGLVNPLILDALVHAGYDRSFDHFLIETTSSLPDIDITVPSFNDVITKELDRTICLPEGSHLDFGGVAKGWAAGQAMERLRAFGPALVSAGGDIAVGGQLMNGDAWSIGIEDPFDSTSYLETIYLNSGGVATSGKDYRFWKQNGEFRHHIIDPFTGLPAETDILTATVIAPTVMQAEALAKAVLISGSLAGLSWLDGDDALAGFLVLENGQCLESRNFNKYRWKLH